jgi:hypothetical protein
MKKIKKAAKSSTPSTQPAVKSKARSAKATASRPKAKIVKKRALVKSKVSAKKPSTQAAAKPQEFVQPVAQTPGVTTITAHLDIGFGNALYLRGEGAGLSWDRGTTMNCVANNCWSLELPASDRPLLLKFLVNDLSWSAGQDYTVLPGESLAITPTF